MPGNGVRPNRGSLCNNLRMNADTDMYTLDGDVIFQTGHALEGTPAHHRHPLKRAIDTLCGRSCLKSYATERIADYSARKSSR